MSVSLSVHREERGPHVTITHDALYLTLQTPSPDPTYLPVTSGAKLAVRILLESFLVIVWF